METEIYKHSAYIEIEVSGKTNSVSSSYTKVPVAEIESGDLSEPIILSERKGLWLSLFA